MNNIFILALIFGTIILVVFSWTVSIKHKRYHGIYRFFSFESVLILFLMGYRKWFYDPFSINQIFSWIFLSLALFLVTYGWYFLITKGKPHKNIENTTNLVTTGLYGYIRHTLYMSVVFLGAGLYLKDIGYFQTVLLMINLFALYLTAKTEEKEMAKKFGEQYSEYMKKTKMFIPFIF